MNRKWTIEIIADFSADPDKNGAMDDLVRNSAATLQAASLLLSNAIRPQTVCYSDDFFVGRTEIDLLASSASAQSESSDSVSDEMLDAFRDMQRP